LDSYLNNCIENIAVFFFKLCSNYGYWSSQKAALDDVNSFDYFCFSFRLSGYIYFFFAIAIAIVIATQKKAATKATTSLPTLLYQWMDDSSIYLIHEGVQPLSHFSSQTKICHTACQLKYAIAHAAKLSEPARKLINQTKLQKVRWKIIIYIIYIIIIINKISVYLTRTCKFHQKNN
jgi:hypothetical protein